ncbi:MAG: FAD-dependent oxidoreductase [Deltaproteobacteria bacterium]|nr:FAD-dependent oxidoreductase [Deltaproteobacteria bacterium]
MARSPLFRTLRRLMQRANVARTGEAPVATSGPSRRDFFLGSIGAAALLPLVQACGDNTQPGAGGATVAIVGGGISGMTCAYMLSLAGVRATVYEASMRIGGRMYTQREGLAGDQLVELGGELVDSDHLVIPALARTLGLTLDDLLVDTAGLKQDIFYFNNAELSEQAIVTAFTPVAAKMAAAVMAGEALTPAGEAEFARIDAMSIPEWLETEAGLPDTAVIRQLLEVAYLEEFGLEVTEQSAWNLITLIDYETPDPFRVFGDSDERYHLHQGNDAIPLALADRLGDQVVLDHALTKVTAQGERVELVFATMDGDVTVLADHVVYALPFTKLREVDLTASNLSAEKLTIINELGYGTNAKLMLQFTDRHWETAHASGGGVITDVGELQATWATSRGQAGAQGILTNFVGGARGVAIGEGSAESQAAMVLPWIDTVLPGTQAKYIANSAIRQHWPSAPFMKGSYACYKVGQFAFFGLEGVAEGGQHFCGEHTSEDYQGYMEGGAETGAMVAAEILDTLEIRLPQLLAGLLSQLVERPRATYHGGFGDRMRVSEIRRRGSRRQPARKVSVPG